MDSNGKRKQREGLHESVRRLDNETNLCYTVLMMNQPIKSLVLGKFLPLHKGHVHLLETARKNSDYLTIVVCSLSNEPIDGKIRLEWVKKAFPDCNVVHLNDDTIPQEPKDHPDFWNIWKTNLRKFHPEPLDYIFTSEEYGYRLAEEMECKHWLVDLERKIVPVSGTKARTWPMKYWDFIPDHVREYFVKKVLITGSESCGKTTLTDNLAKHFNTNRAHEFARDYLTSMNFDMNDMDQIAIGQYDLQEKIIPASNKVFFSDTSAIETYIYAIKYFGTSSATIDKYVELQKERYDLVLLMTPEVKWVDDGLRNLNEVRWEMHQKYIELLDKLGIKYHIISGTDYQERTDKAINLVNSLIGE